MSRTRSRPMCQDDYRSWVERSMGGKQVDRLRQVVVRVQSGRSVCPGELASQLGVCERTIRRDVEMIRKIGIPIIYDPAICRYRLDDEGVVPQASEDMALALICALRVLDHTRLMGVDGDDSGAEALVACAVSATVRQAVATLADRLDVRLPASTNGPIGHVALTALKSCSERRFLSLRTDDTPSGEIMCLVLRPERVAYIHPYWHLMARKTDSPHQSLFNLHRCSELRLLGRLDDDRDERATLDDVIGNAWRCKRGKPFHVRLRLERDAGRYAEEITWHRTQHATWESQDSMIWECDVDGLDEILMWVMGFGRMVEVLEPPELRTMIAREASALVLSHAASRRAPLPALSSS